MEFCLCIGGKHVIRQFFCMARVVVRVGICHEICVLPYGEGTFFEAACQGVYVLLHIRKLFFLCSERFDI